MKRLFCALVAVLALAMCAAPAIRAQAAGAAAYSITSFEGSAVLHENAVLDVTETIVVDFSSPSHGIYRALQTSLVQEKTTGGETVQMPYIDFVVILYTSSFRFLGLIVQFDEFSK